MLLFSHEELVYLVKKETTVSVKNLQVSG